MKVEKVTENDKEDVVAQLQKTNQDLEERIQALENALNERDLIIYNLAVKLSKM